MEVVKRVFWFYTALFIFLVAIAISVLIDFGIFYLVLFFVQKITAEISQLFNWVLLIFYITISNLAVIVRISSKVKKSPQQLSGKEIGSEFLVIVWSFLFNLVLGFALCYINLGLIVPGKEVIGIKDAIYFSVVTMTTLGYGDILPTEAAKSFVAVQAILGLFMFPLLFLAIVKCFDGFMLDTDKQN